MAEDPKPQNLKTVVGVAPVNIHRSSEKAPFVMLIAGEHSGMMLRIPPTGRLIIGRDAAADLTVNDSQCSRRHAQIHQDSSGTVIIEDLGSTNRTVVNGVPLESARELQDGDRIYIGTTTILKFSLQDEIEERFQSNLYRSATRDPLTGVFNKRYFLEALERAVRHHERLRSPLSLLMFDLDHFKHVNDTWGHPAGDEVLKAITKAADGALRAEATLCRYGGEEFTVILSATPLPEAVTIAERLRDTIGQLAVPFDETRLQVSLSIGVAALGGEVQTTEALVAAADEALYRAKREGRNRVRTG